MSPFPDDKYDFDDEENKEDVVSQHARMLSVEIANAKFSQGPVHFLHSAFERLRRGGEEKAVGGGADAAGNGGELYGREEE